MVAAVLTAALPSGVERVVGRIIWRSLGLGCNEAVSCGIGAGSGPKAREHASCKEKVCQSSGSATSISQRHRLGVPRAQVLCRTEPISSLVCPMCAQTRLTLAACSECPRLASPWTWPPGAWVWSPGQPDALVSERIRAADREAAMLLADELD